MYRLIHILASRGLPMLIVFTSSTSKYCHIQSGLDSYMEECSRVDVGECGSICILGIGLATAHTTLDNFQRRR